MEIIIEDISKCKSCQHYTCSTNNIVENGHFQGLKTEQYTCPVRLISRGIDDEQMEKGRVDIKLDREQLSPCIHCGLCIKQCSKNNLMMKDYQYKTNEDFQPITNSPMASDIVGNSIATSYLNHLYDFAANTNIVKTLSFDGYICSVDGKECFVEIDLKNDSLECFRRILADFVLHNHNNARKIEDGLVVLSNIPKEGSRDVYNQVKKIMDFPYTSKLRLYVTTFALLRYYTLNNLGKDIPFGELFYKIGNETKEEYLERIIASKYVTKEISSLIFE